MFWTAGRKDVRKIVMLVLCCFALCAISFEVYGKHTDIKISKHNKKVVSQLCKNIKRVKRENWCAHRGYCTVAPENTDVAFILAAMSGAVAIETDVRISKDGKLFLMHDETVDRMTNGHGKVEKLSSKKIKSLKINNGANCTKFKNLRVCTFEKYLKICKRYKCCPDIELKHIANKKLRKRLLKTLCAEIEKQKMTKQCLVTSFSLDMLIGLRKINKRIPIKLIPTADFYKTKECLSDVTCFKKLKKKYDSLNKGKAIYKLKQCVVLDYPV